MNAQKTNSNYRLSKSIQDIPSRLRCALQDRRRVLVAMLLLAILAVGAFLRFYQLGDAGVGNTYYAAAVKSMLMSWRNFFFVAFEPGGSVSLDKPPLGFWAQAASAYFLGVNGFALALPNALAGVLSIFMVYKLVKRPFGEWAGLIAALALAVMPAAISAERNNTIDGLLVFVLLLAAWAFLQSVYTQKVRWLFIGAAIVGLGFNIKMLQAFLPLPAFYAVYFFGSKQRWWRKGVHLALATLLLIAVSLSWAVAVDLTPASQRPYVDSTSDNSMLTLIIGHNGIERLSQLRMGSTSSQPAAAQSSDSSQAALDTASGAAVADGGDLPTSSAGDGQPPAPPDGMGGQPGGSMDFGSAGTLRLFTAPLSDEASWLLPLVLGGLLLLVITLWKRPFGVQQISLLLWAGWLLPELLYFSYSSGLMHAYYLIMLGAPLAALSGMTAWALWKTIRLHRRLGLALAALLAAVTLAFQAYTLWIDYPTYLWGMIGAVALLAGGIGLALASRSHLRLAPLALTLLLAAVIVAPSLWSAGTSLNASPNSALPNAGPSGQVSSLGGPGGMPGGNPPAMPFSQAAAADGSTDGRLAMPAPQDGNPGSGGPGGELNQELLDYLLANTTPGSYLLATGRANDAAPYILATGRPVLTFGGFLDDYDTVSVEQLASLVESGQLRFVLGSGTDRHAEIAAWVQQNCQVVEDASFSLSSGFGAGPGSSSANNVLYDCRQ